MATYTQALAIVLKMKVIFEGTTLVEDFFHIHQMWKLNKLYLSKAPGHILTSGIMICMVLHTRGEAPKEGKDGGPTTGPHGVLVQIRKGSPFLSTLYLHLPEHCCYIVISLGQALCCHLLTSCHNIYANLWCPQYTWYPQRCAQLCTQSTQLDIDPGQCPSSLEHHNPSDKLLVICLKIVVTSQIHTLLCECMITCMWVPILYIILKWIMQEHSWPKAWEQLFLICLDEKFKNTGFYVKAIS